MLSYAQLRALAIAVAVMLAMIGAAIANADNLGITPRVAAWLGLAGVGLGIVAGFLPTVQGLAKDPTFLEHRIEELPADDRQRLATRLANRAAVEQRLADAQADDERRAERIAERRLPHG